MPKKTLSTFVLQASRHLLQADGYISRFVDTREGRIHYYRAKSQGTLPVMVFLHGLGAHGADLTPLFRPLRKHARAIVVMDLPVHGLSDAPRSGVLPGPLNQMLFEALDSILKDDGPALLFGNSLGGLAAIRYTNYAPKNVHSLVLSSPGGAPVDDEKLQRLRQIFATATQERPGEFVDRLYNKPPLHRRLMEAEIKLRYANQNVRSIFDHFDPDHLLTPEEIQAIQVPTLMIWGKQDRILEEHVEFYREHKPAHFRLEEPAHFTHCPYMEMPEELAIQIRNFARLHA
jgi:abhydrolase domain-containing protein 6